MVALDVGGGPGEHAARWAEEIGAQAVVVDPSPDMNRRCRLGFPSLAVVRAEAERLPFGDDVARLAYFHLSIHHTVWRQALAEAARVVEPGGTVAVMTLGPDHHERSMLQRWFPRVSELDMARFPDPVDLVGNLEELGATVEMIRTIQVKRRRTGDWIDAVRARFVSTLQLLTDEELEAGLDRIAMVHPDDDAPLEYEMLWDEITARFP